MRGCIWERAGPLTWHPPGHSARSHQFGSLWVSPSFTSRPPLAPEELNKPRPVEVDPQLQEDALDAHRPLEMDQSDWAFVSAGEGAIGCSHGWLAPTPRSVPASGQNGAVTGVQRIEPRLSIPGCAEEEGPRVGALPAESVPSSYGGEADALMEQASNLGSGSGFERGGEGGAGHTERGSGEAEVPEEEAEDEEEAKAGKAGGSDADDGPPTLTASVASSDHEAEKEEEGPRDAPTQPAALTPLPHFSYSHSLSMEMAMGQLLADPAFAASHGIPRDVLVTGHPGHSSEEGTQLLDFPWTPFPPPPLVDDDEGDRSEAEVAAPAVAVAAGAAAGAAAADPGKEAVAPPLGADAIGLTSLAEMVRDMERDAATEEAEAAERQARAAWEATARKADAIRLANKGTVDVVPRLQASYLNVLVVGPGGCLGEWGGAWKTSTGGASGRDGGGGRQG